MSELGVERVCCLLHNLTPGGAARQWLHILAHHVAGGGTATIMAPPGPLAEQARAAGVEVVTTVWREEEAAGWSGVLDVSSRHDAAIVHWDKEVMGAFGPALEAAGLAALVVHQSPNALVPYFGQEHMAQARAPIDHAMRERGAIMLVRGKTHRRRFADALGIPADRLRILPASIPMPLGPFSPAAGEPGEILAMARHSPEKTAIPRLAVALARARLARGDACRLALAGDGPTREQSEALCEERLPAGSWRSEPGPADPNARLAAADVVVAQGLTTLEAAALGRRVVVAREVDDGGAAGIALSPADYDDAARDPFGRPALTADADKLWDDLLAVKEDDLRILRDLVARNNSIEAASHALGEAFAATPRRRGLRRAVRLRLARYRT